MMEEGWVAVGVWVREWWKGGGFVEVGRGWGGVGVRRRVCCKWR